MACECQIFPKILQFFNCFIVLLKSRKLEKTISILAEQECLALQEIALGPYLNRSRKTPLNQSTTDTATSITIKIAETCG